MTYVYKTVKMVVGQRLQVPDGGMLVAGSVQPDGRGGFEMIAHILERDDGIPLQPAQKELGQ